ncbi:MAG: transglutaminase domain-containing protein [Faecalibacterium sp.]
MRITSKRIKAGLIALVMLLSLSVSAKADTLLEAADETESTGILKALFSWFQWEESGKKMPEPLLEGLQVEDGRLYHYTNGAKDLYEPGFVTIEDGIYYISQQGDRIDSYPVGFSMVGGQLCHVSQENGPFDTYPAGFTMIDGKLCHLSQEGYVLDLMECGPVELGGGLYYSLGDGSFAVNQGVGHLQFGENGRYTSGNAVLDGYVEEALAACTNAQMTKSQKLRAAYLYVRDHGAYLARPHQKRGTTSWAEESALFMFEHKQGNCYCFAAQFMYMARRLGYDAYVVSGGVGRKDSDHAWVMIHDENGTPYIYDVELEWGYRAGRYGKANYNLYKMPLNKTVFSYQFP